MTQESTGAAEYTARLIDRASDLGPITEDWLRLWREHGQANPFTHPAWISAWLNHLGDGVKPFVISLWEDRRLVGLAPLGVHRYGPWKRLVMLGSPMADYPDFLIHPDHNNTIGFFTNYLVRLDWNWLDLADISGKSSTLVLFKENLKNIGLLPIINRSSVCPGVEIQGGWDDYWTQKKSKTRYTINKKAKRLGAERGPLKLEVLSEGAAVKEGLAEAAGVHAARWARQHTRTIFSEEKGLAFFEEALSGLSQEGIVRLYLLRAGQTLTAFSLSFIGNGIHYYYIPGFDQTYAKDSPGHLLLREIIRESHEHRLSLFDFMRGNEEYKYRWANTHDYTLRLLLSKRDAWSRFGFTLRRSHSAIRDWARKNPTARKLFFGIMNPLARLRRSLGG